MKFGFGWGGLLSFAAAALMSASVQAQVTNRTISEGAVSGELYLPAKVPAPAVFVLHSAYGKVHAGDRAMAKALVEAGFVAFAINYPLAGLDWVPGYLAWMKALPQAAGQPLGAVGFSAGGARIFGFARDPQVKAIVSYYGSYDYAVSPLKSLKARPEAGPLANVDKIRGAAVLLLNGGRDTEVPVESVERMKQALLARGLPAEAVIYPNALHNFDRGPEGNSDRTGNGTVVAYDGTSAKDAQARTIAWFQRYLR